MYKNAVCLTDDAAAAAMKKKVDENSRRLERRCVSIAATSAQQRDTTRRDKKRNAQQKNFKFHTCKTHLGFVGVSIQMALFASLGILLAKARISLQKHFQFNKYCRWFLKKEFKIIYSNPVYLKQSFSSCIKCEQWRLKSTSLKNDWTTASFSKILRSKTTAKYTRFSTWLIKKV